MGVNANIRRIRLEKNMTQKQLAEKCGMYESQIRRYELGKANPKIETLQKIAQALDVPITELKDDLEVLLDKTLQYFDATLSNKALLNNHYDELNEKGQNKAIEQIELLTKIPEYKK